MRPPTGEPDAGDPPVRFGGRGEVQTLVPTPIPTAVGAGKVARTVPVSGFGLKDWLFDLDTLFWSRA